MKGSDLLISALENEGVERIFGIPGEENLAIVEALHSSKINLVLTRHEQAAAFMAEMYGRVTGRAAVVSATAPLHRSVDDPRKRTPVSSPAPS